MKAKDNPNANSSIEYVNSRLMFKPKILDETFITTEFVVPVNVTTKSSLNVTK